MDCCITDCFNTVEIICVTDGSYHVEIVLQKQYGIRRFPYRFPNRFSVTVNNMAIETIYLIFCKVFLFWLLGLCCEVSQTVVVCVECCVLHVNCHGVLHCVLVFCAVSQYIYCILRCELSQSTAMSYVMQTLPVAPALACMKRAFF